VNRIGDFLIVETAQKKSRGVYKKSTLQKGGESVGYLLDFDCAMELWPSSF